MTLDGVTDVGGWYVPEGGHDATARDQFDGAAGMVLGRKTYEGLAAFWPQQTGLWADQLKPVAEVRCVAHAPGTARVERGCGELARHLLGHGLVAELRFWLHPAVEGTGARPYEGARVPMRLLESTSFDSGVTLLRYAPLRGANEDG